MPPGGTNPIVPKPATSHLADPYLIFDNGTLYCAYDDGSDNKLKLTSSTDGITWSTPIAILSLSYTVFMITCPSIVKVGEIFYLYHIDAFVTGGENVINRIRRLSSSSISGPYTGGVDVYFERINGLDWDHNSIRYYNGRYYIMAATTVRTVNTEGDYIYVGVSDDGIHFLKYDAPLITKTIAEEGALYLPSFALIGDQTYAYYSAVRGTPGGWKLIRAKIDILQ